MFDMRCGHEESIKGLAEVKTILKKAVVMGVLLCMSVTPLSVLAEDRDKDTLNKETVTIIENEISGSRDTSHELVGSAGTGQWIRGAEGKWWYKHFDGTYTRGDWEKIGGQWYLFDAAGWMLHGWQKVKGSWYYLGEANDGSMKSGWQRVNGSWYYLGEANDGSMKTGWVKIADYWYFLLPDGQMNTEYIVQGSRSYWFHPFGHLMTSIINIPRQRQEKDNWCWAASAVMIGRYGTGSSISQTQVVKQVKGSVVNDGGTDSEVVSAIKYVSQYGKKPRITTPKSYVDMSNYIDQNKLFAIHMSWTTGGGHMIVGAGYSLDGKSIYCVDPWENTQNRYYNYSGLVNGTTIATGRGRCTSLILY